MHGAAILWLYLNLVSVLKILGSSHGCVESYFFLLALKFLGFRLKEALFKRLKPALSCLDG